MHDKFSQAELEKMADNIMSGFNFEKVHNHMVETGWRWCRAANMGVPTIDDLKTTARYLLTRAIWEKDLVTSCGTGGFMAYKMPWGIQLTFQLESHAA